MKNIKRISYDNLELFENITRFGYSFWPYSWLSYIQF